MRIAVDLDGVCYEWERTVRYMLREYRGYTREQLPESKHWNSIEEQVEKSDWKWLWSDGVREGLFRYGHMMTGARRGLQVLATQGHRFVIVTHRPEAAVPDTIDWVTLYFKGLPYIGINVFSNQEPKSAVRADILIDDKPENVDEWAGNQRSALLFDQPWNQHHQPVPYVTRVKGWEGVVDELAR